ncbi:PRC-barrel domain-containing protein [Dactylosporangium matsuzakiense]|nr:PRC-barrel domain-containing protein [Dactylosporangium matsuzakiense]UWZ42215.1 PRC-barrel domain-containing protein [Dactylosporangium matsuzakiense]
MATHTNAQLIKLSDSDQMLADPDADIRGRKVYDDSGDAIGDIDDLLIDVEEYKVRFLRVEHGGILGFGATPSFVPVDAIQEVTDDAVRVGHTNEQIAGAPRYDPEVVGRPDPDDGYWNGVYGYYGYMPYWAPGYVYPAMPYTRMRRDADDR